MKQNLIELKGEIDKCTVIIGDYKVPFSVIDEKKRQKVSKVFEDLKKHLSAYGQVFNVNSLVFKC